MQRKFREFPFEVKELDQTGEYSGYGSVYGVVDSYREVVTPGAFEKSLAAWRSKKRLPPVLWQHRDPVGMHLEMREDNVGLWLKGKLLVDDVQKAREARALMAAGAVTGLSIGFEVQVEEYNKESKIVTLKEVNLWEVSIVTFPANEAAQIESVKDRFAGKLPSLKEFEEHLREVGFSRSQAKAIASHGLSRLLREAEVRGDEEKAIDVVDAKSILDEILKSV